MDYISESIIRYRPAFIFEFLSFKLQKFENQKSKIFYFYFNFIIPKIKYLVVYYKI